MPLQKQRLDIDFTGGLDKKTDPKLVVPGKLTTLENCVFDGVNTLSKAGGYTSIPSSPLWGGTAAINTAKALYKRKTELLVEADVTLSGVKRSGLFSVQTGPAPGLGQRVSGFVRTAVTVSDIARPLATPKEFDCAAAPASSGVSARCYVWNDVTVAISPVLNVALYDDTTKTLSYVATYPGAGQAHVIWDNLNFVFRVLAVQGSSLLHFYIDPFNTSSSSHILSATQLDIGLVADPGILDVCADGGSFGASSLYAVYRLAAGGFKAIVMDMTASPTTPAILGSRTSADDPVNGLAIATFNTGNHHIAIAAALATSAKIYETDTSYVAAFTTATLVTSNFVRRVALTQTPVGGPGTVRCAWEDGPTLDVVARTNRFVTAKDFTIALAASNAVTVRGVSLASKLFAVGSEWYALLAFVDVNQPTLYLYDLTAGSLTNGVVARILPAQAGGYGNSAWNTSPHLPSANFEAATNIVTLPILRRGSFRLVNGADATPSGIAKLTILFDTTSRPCQSVEFADSTILAGGCSSYYDGQAVTEAGFHTFPDSARGTAQDSLAVGLMTGGAYGVSFVYENYDANGRRWQSAPSIPILFNLANGNYITGTAPTDRLTRRGTSTIAIYCTDANGVIFYRAGSIANDKTFDTLPFTINIANATLIQNEVLYTTGGPLANDPFPACRLLVPWQNRLVMAGLENPFEVRFTEPLRDGVSPNHSNFYSIVVPPGTGEITALAVMDDKLLIATEHRWYYVYGTGPNRLGVNNNYSDPQVALSDMGCRLDSPNAVVVVPDGCWFRTDQGFRQITRGLQIARHYDPKTREPMMFFGAEVDALVTGCVNAITYPGKQMIWFYTGSSVLLYDYQWQQWSTLTNFSAVSAIDWTDASGVKTIVHLTSAGALFESTPNVYTQNGVGFLLKAETAWLRMAGVQGYQRAYEMEFLGGFVGNCTIKIEVGYDYKDAYTGTASVAASAVGGAGVPVQFRYQFGTQVCESLRFRISESVNAGTGGFTLTSLGLLVGVKKGAVKLPSAQSIG